MKNAGAQIDTPVSLLDIYPTLVDLAGLPRPSSQLEGESLEPLLKKPSSEREAPAITTFEANNHAIRSGPWRYIRYANGDEELYHLERDPHEWDNLAGKPESKSVIQKLKQFLPKKNVPSTEERGPAKKRRKAN